jgi:predicted negative regulator of RcsB-dependent stress response
VRGTALARLGQSEAAVEAWQQSLQAARSRGAEYEVALTERAAADANLVLQPPLVAARSRS